MTSNKKSNKKVQCLKDVTERSQIVEEVVQKLMEVHLVGVDENGEYYSGFHGIEEFLKVLKEYKKENVLTGFSGVIKVPELDRNIEYILPTKKHVDHGVRLVSTVEKDYTI
jgi:hypothetical protein